MGAHIIEAQNLTKTYRVREKQPGLSGTVASFVHPLFREIKAVQGISLQVDAGEAVAFIGPNGGGKSTTIKLLTGILHPTSGSASVLQMTPWRDRPRLARRIGAVFGQRSHLWPHLPAMDCFRLLSYVYEIPQNDFHTRLRMLTDLFEIDSFLQIPTRKLSLGQRTRCEIVASLLHRPEILFLDEPTIGLDVVAKLKIRDLLVQLNRREGVTLFLTSHDVRDIEMVCRRAVIMNHGQLISDTTVTQLKEKYMGVRSVRIHLTQPVAYVPFSGITVSEDGYDLTAVINGNDQAIYEAIGKILQRYPISDMLVSETPLEEVIATIYQEGRTHTA